MEQSRIIISVALKGVALAMAVATVVLGVLGSLSADAGVAMLYIGLFALALEAFRQN